MDALKRTERHEWILEGLDCANCALKIENGVSKIEGVLDCSVNFVTKTLTMTTSSDQKEEVFRQTERKVHRLEPHVRMVVKNARGRLREDSRSNAGAVQSDSTEDCACGHEHDGEGEGHTHEVGQHAAHSHAGHHHGAHGKQAHTHDGHNHGDHGHEHHNHHAEHEHGEATHAHSHSHGDDGHAGHTHDHGTDGMRRMIARLAIGAVVAAVAWWLPVEGVGKLALFLLAYIIVGGDVVLQAARSLVRGMAFDEYFLMTLATVGAFAIGEYPEGVAVMFFYQIGELFQGIAVNRSRKSISDLMDIRPDYANLKTAESVRRVSPEDVRIGDLIVIKPGEKIPLDGKVIDGKSHVDTSALTGESVPRTVEPGSSVLSGFINTNGLLTVEVSKEFSESAVSKILELVQNASAKKAPTEKFITKFSRYYTPVVVIVALLLAVVPPLVVPGAQFADWVYRALVFLVISCPCALVVSIPLGFFGGIGAASRSGILIKGGNYLEALNHVKYAVFDKTGTLTKGVFRVTGIYPAGDFTNESLLETAALAELHSTHPIAASLRESYGKELRAERVQQYSEISGHGIQAQIDGRLVSAGNAKLMEREHVAFNAAQQAGTLDEGTVVHVAVDGTYAGCILISDEVKEDAAQTVASLKKLGVVKTIMLTGDNRTVAEAVGRQLGLDEVRAELLPQHKAEAIEQLSASKKTSDKILFVGDGINDTPVLALADVGVAMGGLGSDAAIEAADIVIMNDEPSRLVTAIHIAKRTRRIVWQNIIFALGVKAVFLTLGAFGIATMWEAVFSDVGVTLLAVLNVMRVLKVRSYE
ncbi:MULTISPECIES: heavy metal translocating P-type ATPase [Paenibacillus]|uniref:Cd(2+)-exporting ATPase n=1 Tax=Paenibacillus peoriae TaxID=59893 RepID=A0ABU1QKL4_9BACL|nr:MULTISPECIES: heavy metal translocating P-type ATPase [Paenibacillus]AIW41614.1 cadmium transporter [Paenibacillus polymyxa CR1]MCP3746902.1 heavy metal translocating P-type ATPase [Paenibacillus sp. A3M_27_13]MDR6780108.1 Cd2+/Zn2+-exporting ATPase [Paenibacillus peoriae]OMF26152.1 cadmium-translocating P-type ATPase [Paenibacillus peoriae]